MNVAGRVFMLLAYLRLNSFKSYHEFYTDTRLTFPIFWFILTFESIMYIGLLVWMLWKITFINRSLKKLKNSDEFPGEYFKESNSNCAQKEKNKQKEEKEKKEKTENKQNKNED